jgi:hypothetical protein
MTETVPAECTSSVLGESSILEIAPESNSQMAALTLDMAQRDLEIAEVKVHPEWEERDRIRFAAFLRDFHLNSRNELVSKYKNLLSLYEQVPSDESRQKLKHFYGQVDLSHFNSPRSYVYDKIAKVDEADFQSLLAYRYAVVYLIYRYWDGLRVKEIYTSTFTHWELALKLERRFESQGGSCIWVFSHGGIVGKAERDIDVFSPTPTSDLDRPRNLAKSVNFLFKMICPFSFMCETGMLPVRVSPSICRWIVSQGISLVDLPIIFPRGMKL